MSELNFEEPFETTDVEIPSTLPVLPLKETVVFPQSVSPLAIGQERSIQLVDDVLEGERMLALVTVKNPEVEQPGWDDLYETGTAAVVHKMIRVPDGTLRILVQGVGRIKLERHIQDDPYLVGEFTVVPDEVEETPELEALTRSVQNEFGRLISLVPYLPSELELAAANVDDPSALSHLVASTLRLKTEREAGAARAERRLGAAARRAPHPQARARGRRARHQDPVAGPVGAREGPARVLPAPAAEGDPGRARRGRRAAGRAGRAARAGRAEEPPRGHQEGRRARALAAREAAAGLGRVRRDPHVRRLDPGAALERDHRGQPRPRARARDPRRGPLRPREGQGADPRVPRRLEAEERPLRPDPLLRRPARRRQDLARPVDRAHGRAQVRPALGRRRARRGRDPRPPPHLHRRDAGHDHPLAARRRVEEPGAC